MTFSLKLLAMSPDSPVLSWSMKTRQGTQKDKEVCHEYYIRRKYEKVMTSRTSEKPDITELTIKQQIYKELIIIFNKSSYSKLTSF